MVESEVISGENGYSNTNIIVVNTSPIYTGIGRYAVSLSNAIDSNIISLRMDKTIERSYLKGKIIEGTYLPFLSTGWYLNSAYPSIFMRRYVKYIRKNIKLGKIVHYASPNVYPVGNDIDKQVVTIHDLFAINNKMNNKTQSAKITKKILYDFKNFENILTVSNYIARQLNDEGFDGNIRVIYPPISETFMPLRDKINLRKNLNLPLDKKLVLSVSTDEPRKNLKAVSETVDMLGSNYVLIRVGKGVGKSIVFTNVDDNTLNMIYNASDVLLFPSLDEGFGFPLAEAMRVGLPVVCSDIDVFREIGKDAVLFSDPDPDKLAKAVKEALSHSNDLVSKGFNVAQKYTFQEFRKSIRNFYRSSFNLSIPE